MDWKPIYTDQAEIEKINLKIDEIADELVRSLEKMTEPSLLKGYTGVAVFLAYYGKFRNSQQHMELAVNAISNAVDAINNTNFSSIAFAGGVSGICWGIQHLIQEDFVDADPDDLFNEIDEIIGETIKQQLKAGNFDYLHGGMGPMLYLLHRNKKSCFQYMEEAIQELKNSSLQDKSEESIKWESFVNWDDKQISVFNLSLSHGISSIINILSRCLITLNDSPTNANIKKLVTASLNYLKQQKNAPGATSAFPLYIVKESGEIPDSDKIAWCYGDLGVAASLLYVSTLLKDEQLKQFSLNIFEEINKRKRSKTEGIKDAALCHGTGGIAHIYQRAYNYTSNEEYKELAKAWYELTLNFAYHQDGLAGYKAGTLDGYENESGLLEGIAGIGLTMISSISGIEPKWDECLLLS